MNLVVIVRQDVRLAVFDLLIVEIALTRNVISVANGIPVILVYPQQIRTKQVFVSVKQIPYTRAIARSADHVTKAVLSVNLVNWIALFARMDLT